MSLAKDNIVKAILGFSLPTWINVLIGIFAVPLVTRLFAPEVLGKFNLFCTYGYILCCVALAGLNQGYMRFYNEPIGKDSHSGLYKLSLMLALLSTAVVGLLIFVFRYNLSALIIGEYSGYIPFCLVIYVFSHTVLNIESSVYRMQNLIIAFGVLTILMNLCGKLSYAGAVFFNDKLFGAILLFSFSYLAVAMVYSIRSLLAYRGERLKISKQDVYALLKYSIPLMPVLFIAQINTALPKIVINEHLDYSQVGIYAAAFSIVGVISVVQSGLNIFWTPFVFENYKERPQYLLRGHQLIIFAITIFGLFAVMFQDVIYLIIGENYRSGQIIFALLLFSPICYTISETTGIGINISKKTYLNVYVYIITAAASLITCFLLIPKLGLIGAALSVAISSLCMLICKTAFGEKHYKVISVPMKSFLAPLLFLLVAGLDTVFFNEFVIRTVITGISIVIMLVVYKDEFVSVFKILMEVVGKKANSPFSG